jgi:hypothetical protein
MNGEKAPVVNPSSLFVLKAGEIFPMEEGGEEIPRQR